MSATLPAGPRYPALAQLMRFATQPFAFFEACAEKHGDDFTVDMANFGKFVMVSSPELLKQVFTAGHDELLGGAANRDIEPFVGPKSLLRLDGNEHRRHRQLMLPSFHGKRMEAYARVVWEESQEAVGQMPNGRPFALHPYMQRVTLRIILRAVLGLEPGPRFARTFDALVSYLEPPSPVLLFLPQVDWPMSPYRRFLTRRNAVDHELYALIRERRAQPEALAERTDILSLLLLARDENEQALSDSELRDELMTLLIAGHETTATSLSWAFERVLSHPEVEQTLRTELATAGPMPASLLGLPYLDGVIRETLRMRPILPTVVREVQAEPFRLGPWNLPKGTRISPCLYLAHHRPESWPQPKQFSPQRFVGMQIDPYRWLPFGGGNRRCIGLSFALFEMRLVLGAVFTQARPQLASPKPVRPVRRGVTIGPGGGTRVVLT